LDTSSIMGLKILQGPHQAAQKSTTTGVFDLRTSASKSLLVTSATRKSLE
jgi:hypothetical protein